MLRLRARRAMPIMMHQAREETLIFYCSTYPARNSPSAVAFTNGYTPYAPIAWAIGTREHVPRVFGLNRGVLRGTGR